MGTLATLAFAVAAGIAAGIWYADPVVGVGGFFALIGVVVMVAWVVDTVDEKLQKHYASN